MNRSLEIFLKYQILPIYDAYDGAHDAVHAENVYRRAIELGNEYALDANMCAAMAAYHDVGMRYGRETHHITSAKILYDDSRLRRWFSESEILTMRDAIEDHRASAENPPRSVYGKVLADADREYTPERIISRTMRYGMAKYPELDINAQISRAREHITEKYGENGYLSFYLESKANDDTKKRIVELLNDDAAFRAECVKYVSPRASMSISKYLNRIGIAAPKEPSLEFLNELQAAHLRHVPYENMDIRRGIPISLGRRELYDKIVNRNRGGYCFELNEMFGWLLRALGYHVTDLFARFLAGESEIPMRRHHVLKVNMPGSTDFYLCDVGVGSGSPTYPVKICAEIQPQYDFSWRIEYDDFLGSVLRVYKHDEWHDVFSFTDEPQLPVDFTAASVWCEKSDLSPFNKAPMISMRTENGRITLDGDEFRVFEGENVSVTRTNDVNATLRDKFGIVL